MVYVGKYEATDKFRGVSDGPMAHRLDRFSSNSTVPLGRVLQNANLCAVTAERTGVRQTVHRVALHSNSISQMPGGADLCVFFFCFVFSALDASLRVGVRMQKI